MEQVLKFRHNAMDVSSVTAFAHIKGGVRQNTKDVYFVRLLGDNGTLLRDVDSIDAQLSAAMAAGSCVYQRITKLPGLSERAEADAYASCYDAWHKEGEQVLNTKTASQAGIAQEILSKACLKTVQAFASCKPSFSDSMRKNFVVKLLYWADQVLQRFPGKWQEGLSVKIVSHNIVKSQEYCFFYFLTLLGMDVLLLQSRQDIEPGMDALGLSKKYQLGNWTEQEFPEYDFAAYRKVPVSDETGSISQGSKPSSVPIKVHIPKRRTKSGSHTLANVQRPAQQSRQPSNTPVKITLPKRETSIPTNVPGNVVSSARQPSGSLTRREKTFEELALLASSVVLVGIHDNRGEMVGTGSGIMIGAKGYILTNNHVASRGCFYSVRIEEDDKVYETEDIIKYHSLLDLAILRIDRRLQPLPVYSGRQKLVRGQQVVAIGSPLGLFNSVSDGIISGFRVIDDVDMIQFTAPISHGSSGGALLNMYGEVIGISTAGIDEGQNINLAVGYECIQTFIQGFTG